MIETFDADELPTFTRDDGRYRTRVIRDEWSVGDGYGVVLELATLVITTRVTLAGSPLGPPQTEMEWQHLESDYQAFGPESARARAIEMLGEA